MQLKIISTPGTTNELVTTNCVYVSIGTFGCMKEEGDEVPVYVKVNNECVYICRGSSKVEADCIALNCIQRRACRASLGTILTVSKYVPPVKNFLLSSITVEIDYLRKPAYDSPVDVKALSEHIKALYNNQILRLEQQWVTEFEGVSLLLTVAELEVIESLVKEEDQMETVSMQPTMGMINPQTIVILAKHPKSTIELTNLQS